MTATITATLTEMANMRDKLKDGPPEAIKQLKHNEYEE